MSLLDATPPQTLTDAQKEQQRKAQIHTKVSALLTSPAQNFNNLFNQWNQGMSFVWDDPNPADILEGIGIHAVELFALSSDTAKFLESLRAGCTTATMAKVKSFTENPDGTITLK